MAQSDTDVVRTYVEAVGRFDLDTVRELVTDDVVMHIPGRNKMSGDRRGREALLEMFQSMRDMSGGQPVVAEIHDICAGDGHVVALLTRTIAGVEARAAVVYHVADGKISEIWPHEQDQYALDEAVGAGS